VTLTAYPLLVPWSWKSRAIPLLLLWAVRPVQSLSACTRGGLYFCLFKITIKMGQRDVLFYILFSNHLNDFWISTISA